MTAHLVVVAVVLAVALAGAVGGAADARASGAYGVTTGASVATPAADVALGGTPVAVVATAAHRAGDPLVVTATAPDAAVDRGALRVDLYDRDGARRASTVTAADGTATLGTDALTSGTYYVAVRADGAVRAAERVVVSRYDVSVGVHEGATTPDELALHVGVLPGAEIPYHAVEVVATDGVHETVVAASEVRLGLYEASVDRRALPPGEYVVFARLAGRPGPFVGMSGTLPLAVAGDPDTPADAGATASPTAPPADAAGATDESGATDAAPTTATRLPATGVALLLAALLAVGVARRLRRR